VAFVVRGWSGPLLVIAVAIACAATAGILRRSLAALLLTTPLVLSIVLVNTFLYPGAHDIIVGIGPIAATGTGLTAAFQAVLRVVAFGLSVVVFSFTTTNDDLVTDLEHRGLGRRAVFVIGAAIGMVPRMAERAAEIVDSQRARGLDTEGALWRRIRGVVPLAGPMIFGALTEVEERTLALEARGFSAPPRRTTLRPLPDDDRQRALRWALLGLVVLVVVTSAASWLALP